MQVTVIPRSHSELPPPSLFLPGCFSFHFAGALPPALPSFCSPSLACTYPSLTSLQLLFPLEKLSQRSCVSPDFTSQQDFNISSHFFKLCSSFEPIMDIEKPSYRDEGRDESEARDSRSVGEEYEGLVTGVRLPRPTGGTKFKKLVRLAPIFLLISFTLNIFQIAYTIVRRPQCLSLYGMCSPLRKRNKVAEFES